MKIEITMEKTLRVSMDFEATQEQVELLEKGINPFQEKLEEKLPDGDVEYDYAVNDEDGNAIVPWGR